MKRLENKTILVTGATGFIGSHLVSRLSKIDGVRLLLLSRQHREPNYACATMLKGRLAELTPTYWNQHRINHIDVVFHLGAFTPKTGVDANRVDRVFEDNLEGTRALLKGLPDGVECIVFSSTLDVYSMPNNGEVLTEQSRIEPAGLYGASKFFCERLVSVWAQTKKCKYAILRYGHIFGPGEEAYGKLIPSVIRQLLSGKPPVVYGDGSAKRDFLYVADAVEATIRASVAEGDIGPINIVRGESCSIREIVEMLIEQIGFSVKINFLRDKPNGNSFQFDNSAMTKALGIWPFTILRDGLIEEVNAYNMKPKI